MKKILNFRPLVFFAVALILGVIVTVMFASGEISFNSFICFVCIFAFILLSCILAFIIFKKDEDFKRLFKRILCFCLATVIGGGTVYLSLINISSHEIKSGEYLVCGRIATSPAVYEDKSYSVITIDEITLVSSDGESFLVKDKAKIYVYDENYTETLEIGNIISFSANMYFIKIAGSSASSSNFNDYVDGIYLKGTAKSDITLIPESKLTVFEKLKLSSKDLFVSTLGDEYSGLAYGMVFGDKSLMQGYLQEDYSNAGIAHLLAVSGLHVGFFVTIISLILKLLKVGDKTNFISITVFLFLYVIICNFTASVVRAFIMTTCMLYAKLRNKKYDSLSALALAAIIILFISPMSLFDVGFQLSFCAVLGIILLSKPLSNFFSKFLFRNFAEALALSLSASIGIIPITTSVFGTFSLLAVFTNMIVIPIASIAYMYLFVTLVFSLLIPAISIIMLPFKYIMSFVSAVALVAANISINSLPVGGRVGLTSLFIGGMVISSDYIFIGFRKKCISVLSLLCVCLLIMFV